MSSPKQDFEKSPELNGKIVSGELIVDDVNVANKSPGKSQDAALQGTEQALNEKQSDRENANKQNGKNGDDQIVEKEDENLNLIIFDDKDEQQNIEMQILQNEIDKDKKQDRFDLALKEEALKEGAQNQPTTDQGRTSVKGKQDGKTPGRDPKNKKGTKVQKNQDPNSQNKDLQKGETMKGQQIKSKTKQNTYEQQKLLQKQFKQKQMELKKSQDQSQQIQKSGFSLKALLTDNLFLRKCWRIFLLILIVFAVVGLILVFYYEFGFVRGSRRFKNNEKVSMEINSCTMMIYDIKLRDTQILDTNFLAGTLSTPKSLDADENIYMQWIYPDAPVQKNDSTYGYSSDDNGAKKFKFNNKFSDQSCELVLYVYKETKFEELNIDCGDSSQCNIIINSSLFSVKSMNIKGINVQMNAPHLTVDTKFDYFSMKGHIEIPYFTFKDASIITREGDVSVQSEQDINLSFFQKDPFNCLTAKKVMDKNNAEITATEFQTALIDSLDTNCKKVFPYGVEDNEENKDKLIEQRCYKGEVQLRNKDSAASTLYVENSFGNIYVNVISEKGNWPSDSKVVFNKALKKDAPENTNQDYINLSTQTQIDLFNQTKSAQNPQVYDPIFVYYFGPKFTRSNTFQQLQMSYNPAYSYMKPYWLGELTFTLMTTQKYSGQYTISPGFCPYIPSLSLERMHNTQQLVKSFMESNKAPEYAKISTSWQADISYPPQKFLKADKYDGFKKISLKRYYDEQWLDIQQDQAHVNSVTSLDVSQNSSLYAAIIVSCILSAILGIILMVLLVFAINQNYIWILNHISCVRKYSTLEKGGGGEIDESTLDVSKRRFYLDYMEEQKNMEEQTKNALKEAGEDPEQEERGFQPKYTITSIFGLFYQLVYMSPPLSAFIDYIVLLFHKAKQNSIQEFYKLLFRKKKLKELKETDEEIHDLEKDSIYGNEMKQLYEKYCYLNQYLERKFDDDENVKFLQEKGFKIVARSDAQTQYYTFIKYNGIIPNIIDQSNKSSLDLFISNCCSLTKFDQDRIESSVLDQIYQEFCNTNHMQKQQLNEGQLKRDFGIQTSYLPQQWVERDDKFDVQKMKKKYFIDKKKVENNFKIILAKDSFLFNILYDTDDIKEAQKDIKVPTGWQIFDFVTVIAHITTMALLGSPLLLLAIFLRAQQASYSLLPPFRLIYMETIQYYPTSIPAKLIDDNWIVQAITIITVIFWCLSFWDLIYYYASMDFPQEKYFYEYKLVGRFRKFLSGIMWIIVLIALFSTAVYFSLVAIWLMLSAIINPNAFLPYATSAATFVTLVTKKYKEFEEVSQNGFKILSDYLSNLAQGQFQDLLKKMNIQDKIADVIPTDTIKDITSEAAKLGIIDPATCDDITNNLEIMIRDPNTVSKLGSELMKISEDPNAFAAQMAQKLEEKAKAIILQQVQAIDKDLREELVNLFWCLLKSQKSELKNAISSFVNGLINVFQKKQGKQLLKNLGFLNLKGPVFDFIWEFAFPQDNFKGNYQDHLTNVFCVALSNMIQVWNKQLKSVIMIDAQEAKKKQQQQDQKGNKNKKKQNQQQEKTESQILKEKLMKELEKAEAIIQADIGQEEEIEIELTSEEAIAFAYKNIIYSVIQICRAINSGNSEVILNQILSLVQNTSKLPGFEGLNQVKQYQDVFKLGYAIFKNDGQISYQDVSLAFKSFLKNSGLEQEVKDIAGVGILDILKIVEVIVESFKNQSKPLSSQNIKRVISNLLGSIEFVSKRTKLQNQEFKKVEEMNDVDECLKMKDDVTNSLEETKATILDLEQQRQKAKQNEEYYKDKLETSIYYVRYYCKVLLEQKPDYEQSKVDEIDNLSGEKVYFELEKLVEDTKKIGGDKNKKFISQKAEIMKDFAQLKQEKADQYQKMVKLEEKMEPYKQEIKALNEKKNNASTAKQVEKDKEVNKHRETIKERAKVMSDQTRQMDKIKSQLREKEKQKDKTATTLQESEETLMKLEKKRIEEAEKKNMKENQSVKSKKSRQSQNKSGIKKNDIQEEEEEQLLVNDQQDIDQYSDVPSEKKGEINVFFTNIHSRNNYNFGAEEADLQDIIHEELQPLKEEEKDERTEEEKKLSKEIAEYKKQLKDLEADIARLKADIIPFEVEIKRLEGEIKEINEQQIDVLEKQYLTDIDDLSNKFTTKQLDEKLNVIQEEYDRESEFYDKIINKISHNMSEQEEIEYDMKSNDENTSSCVKDSQLYMDDYKSSQKQLNRMQEEKIDIHDQIDKLQEKKLKAEEYIAELEIKCKKMMEDYKENKKEKDEQNKNNAKKEAEQREDFNSLASSGITLMLNFFSGSISNISAELIKDFGGFFKKITTLVSSDEEAIINIFDFLSRQICGDESDEKQKSKMGGEGKQRVNNFQSLLNLMEIFMNDAIISVKKMNKNGVDSCGIEETLVHSLQVLLTARFDGIIKLKTINNHLKGSQLLENISKVMKIKEDVVLGLMEMIMGFKYSKDVSSFINFAATLNKVKENKIPILLNLYNLYSSTSPSELYQALSFFQVTSNLPKEFAEVTIKDLVQAILFMRGQLDFSNVQTIIEKKLKLPADEKREQNPKIQLEIKERMKFNFELPSHFKRLLEMEHKGYLVVTSIQADFKDINKNLTILLDNTDFNFFKKFASIRNIPKIEDASQNTLLKSSMTDISEMLNIDYLSVEFFLNLLTSSKPNKLQQSLDLLNLKEIDPNIHSNSITNFVDYSSSVLEKLEQRNSSIVNVQKNIFSNTLPMSVLKKVLFAERSSVSYDDQISLFQLYCGEIPKESESKIPKIPESIQNLIDFRFGIGGNKKKNIFQFLFPNMSKSEMEKSYPKFKKESPGLLKAVQIISIDDESQRIKVFLQYLIKTDQEALLLMSCLLVYFSGRSNNITLSIKDPQNKSKQKTVTVEQLLGIQLEVKIEFFEAIRTFFQEDIIACTSSMIKFYRQLDYQQQQEEDENAVMENNITISDKVVEQYYRLVNHMQMNTSFFSKESNIPIEVVELISQIMLVKNAKNEQERQSIFDSMRNNSQVTKILSQLGVNLQELISLIKIMYLEYEPTNIKWISRQLKLSSNFKIDGLQQLIMLDQVLPTFGENQQNHKLLRNLIKTNKFVKNFKVNTTWAEVAYILSKGDFNLLSKYQDKLIALKYPSALRFEEAIGYHELKQARNLTQAVNAKELKYISLVQGLTGLLSCRNSQFLTTEYLYQLYTIISQKYFKEENITIEDGLKKGNTLQYAIYKFTKSTQISPVWTLLMMGDFNAWQYLAESHYLVNNGKNESLHPILTLVYVINFRANPLIVKQLLVDLEYAQRSYQIYIAELKKENIKRQTKELKKQNNPDDYYEEEEKDEFNEQNLKNLNKKKKQKIGKQDKDKEIKVEFNDDEKYYLEQYEQKIKNMKIQINNILIQSLEKDAEKLIHLAEDFNFPKKIINMLLIYENEYGKKKEDEGEEKQPESENRLTNDMIHAAFEPVENMIDQNKIPAEYKELELLNEVFGIVDTDFYTDPRKEKFNQETEEKNFTKNYCLQTHTSSPIMQMTILSTIAQLKSSYYNFYGFTGRDEDHYKQVTFAIDLILGTLEKYYYFDDMMDFFPRHRLIPLIGLSVGFVIETDDILSSMTSQNIFDTNYYDQVIYELCCSVHVRQSKDESNEDAEDKLDQKTFQKYIDFKKFNLKYRYFKETIINVHCNYQVENNYSYQEGIFKGIYQSEVLAELEKKNLEKLIDHFEDLMWTTYDIQEILYHVADSKNYYSNNVKRSDYIEKSEYDNMDHYSGEKYKHLFEQIDEYQQQAETENFRLLVDIFRGNYKSLNNNYSFVSSYAQDSNVYYGMLLLNGIIVQERQEVKIEDFQQSITATSLYMSSNKKSLTEILSMFIPSIKTNFASILEQLNVTEDVIRSFVDLAMDKSIDQSHDLNNLLKKSSLSGANKQVLKDSIWAIQGEMSEHMRLIHCSNLFNNSPRAIIYFTKFLWSFEKSQMHKSSNNTYEINYFDYCNLSPNRAKALEKSQQYLWRISVALCYEKYAQNDMKKTGKKEPTLKQEEFKLQNIFKGNKYIRDNQISLLLQKILYNDWNFLTKNIKEFYNQNHFKIFHLQIRSAFDSIFQTQPADKVTDLLQFLALMKPEKCNLQINNQNFEECVNNEKVNKMFELGKSSKIKIFSNDSEKRSIHLMLSLANNSLVHILNCLNTNDQEWNQNFQEEAEEEIIEQKALLQFKEKNLKVENTEYDPQADMFQIYYKLKKESIQKLKEKRESLIQNSEIDVNSNQKYKYIAYILQSLYVWKNISNINWDAITKNSAAFLDYPYKFKDNKIQMEFTFNCVDYLTILPAVILDKSGLKPTQQKKDNRKSTQKHETPDNQLNEDSTTFKVIQKLSMKFRNLDTDIFVNHLNVESNSIFRIYQSYDKLVQYMAKYAEFYYGITEDEPEEGEDYKPVQNLKVTLDVVQNKISAISPDLFYLLQFLNGRVLKDIQKSHPLIDYLSNLYFVGLEAIHTQKPINIVNYLEESIKNEHSFMNQILKENTDYAVIFNKILSIVFTISFSTINDSKIDKLEKENILKQIDDLVFTVSQDLLQVDDTIINLVYAVFYLITGQETERMKDNKRIKDKQDCLIILLKIAFENPDLSEFFFGSAKAGEGIAENIDKMINTMTNLLQSILDKPSQSINDSDLVKEVLKLVKYASKGTIDITIIEDIIAILTGDHQRVFNILKKFEIVDENKILLIQRAYNQVAEMPIFQNKDKSITGGSSGEQSDKMKEIVKKMQEGKATIKDVFVAVDNEGDNSGTISIDEFQSFVRRLGMELSRHRVNEIFAFIKNKKLKSNTSEKQEELTLNEEEFDKAFKYVNDKKTSMSLEKLGISPALLALALGTLIVVLILLFVFIFLGINAFTVGGTFGAIINSIIPMTAAGGAAGSQENKKDKLQEEEVQNAVQETQSIIHSEHL